MIGEELNHVLHISDNRQSTVTSKFDSVAKGVLNYFAKRWSVSEKIMGDLTRFVSDKEAEWPKSLNELPQEEVYLLRGMIQSVLHTSLEGVAGVNFGLSIIHKLIEYAISYAGNNKPKENAISPSQPKNPHEVLLKTYFWYLFKGLKEEQVVKLLTLMREEALKENKTLGKPLQETTAWELFSKMAPVGTPALTLLTQSQMRELTPEIHKNPYAVKHYIRSFIWSKVGYYPESIISNAQNLKTMVYSWRGLSATPLVKDALGSEVEFIPVKDAFAKALYLLMTKIKNIHVFKKESGEILINKTLDLVQENRKRCAVIDVGACFSGIGGEDVAKRLFERYKEDESVEEIIYYDENRDTFVVLNTITKKSVEVGSDFLSNPEKRMFYYDQLRSSGSDFKWIIDGIGLLLLKRNLTFDRVAQGAGRARIPDTQGLEAIISEQFKNEIFGDNPPIIGDLIACLLANQVREEEETTLSSQRQQLSNEFRRAVLDTSKGLPLPKEDQAVFDLNTPIDVDLAIATFKRYKYLLKKTESCSAKEMYGVSQKSMDSDKYLEGKKSLELGMFKKHASYQLYNFVENRIKKLSKSWPEMQKDGRVPPKSLTGFNKDPDVEIIVERQLELSRQVESQVSPNKILREVWLWGDKFDPYQKGWENPYSINFKMIAYRVNEVILNTFNAIDQSIKSGFRAYRKFTMGGKSTGIQVLVMLIECVCVGALGTPAILLTTFFVINQLTRLAGRFTNLSKESLDFLEVTKKIEQPFKALLGLYFVYGKLPSILKYVDKSLLDRMDMPILSVRDYFSRRLPSQFKGVSYFFSPALLASNNFYNELSKSGEGAQRPFGMDQKPLLKMLVIQDEVSIGHKKIQMLLLDQNDSQFFSDYLLRNTGTKESEPSKRKLCLIDISGKILIQGKDPIAKEELWQDKTFCELFIQAKIMRGIFITDPEELVLLKGLTEKTGSSIFNKFFVQEVLKYRLQKQEFYPQSSMGKELNR